jgi:hypothetical protein
LTSWICAPPRCGGAPANPSGLVRGDAPAGEGPVVVAARPTTARRTSPWRQDPAILRPVGEGHQRLTLSGQCSWTPRKSQDRRRNLATQPRTVFEGCRSRRRRCQWLLRSSGSGSSELDGSEPGAPIRRFAARGRARWHKRAAAGENSERRRPRSRDERRLRLRREAGSLVGKPRSRGDVT